MGKTNGWIATLVASFVLTASVAHGDEGVRKELEALRNRLDAQSKVIDAQQKKLQALESEQQRDWMSERRAAEVKALVHEVLQDAEQRASLLEGGMTAGWNNGFFVQSADGNNYLRILGFLQFRHVLNLQDDSGGDDTTGGFETTRVWVMFKGHLIDKSWQYFILADIRSASAGTRFLDAWVEKQLSGSLEGFSVRVGSFKVPLWKEFILSSTRQQFVERSLLTGEYSGVYTEGIALTYEQDKVRAVLSINDGLAPNGLSTTAGGFGTPGVTTDTVEGVAVTGRVEYLARGDWKTTADFKGDKDGELMLVFGGAAHFQQGEYGTAVDEARLFRWVVDAHGEYKGLSVFVAFVGNHISDSASIPSRGVAGSLDQYGLLAQAGYMVTDDMEVAVRYEWGDSDIAGEPDLSVITIGFTKYFKGHSVKWITDIGYAFNGVATTWASGGAGYRTDAAGQDGQIVIRTQLNLLF